MTKKYKLICMDMDGTLLNNDGQITPYTESVLKEAAKRGAVLCMTSARPIFEITVYCRQLGIDSPIIACNGAYVYDAKEKSYWHSTHIPVDETLEILRYCEENRLFWTLLNNETVFFPEDAPDMPDMYAQVNDYYVSLQQIMDQYKMPRYGRKVLRTQSDLVDAVELGAGKITVEGSPEKMAVMDAFYKDGRKYKTISKQANPRVREITHYTANKWNGVEIVAKKLGIPMDEVCTFGDNLNDLEMIKNCPNSFVMANGDKSIFKYATHVIDSNADDGVGKAIEKYILDNIIA